MFGYGWNVTIPGQTGCLAIHDVLPPTHRRKKAPAQKKIISVPKTATEVLPNGEPHFCGGTLEKKSKNTMTYRRYKRNIRAHNTRQHSRRVRPQSRVTIRRFVQMTEREWDDILRDLYNYLR